MEEWSGLFYISEMSSFSKAGADRTVEDVLIKPEFRSEQKVLPSIVTQKDS